ncbi:MAG: SDR family NAD(P)-dependent oxidoreductase, partial [Clostridia bacterium]|nr:SDR family NAD(P)-dependent oxidoreductase [Clostridia bacterium]
AQDQERLIKLRDSIGDKARTFSMDLTDRGNIALLEKLLQDEDANILYLINCAGYAKFGDYSAISRQTTVNMIDLNVSALVALTLICIPFMPRGAHIINMASQAAFQPVPYQNVYSATKAFVLSYTRALNVELKEKHICATSVCPGWMNTRLIERAKTGARKTISKFPFIVEPSVVAKKALKDANKSKDMSVYGIVIKLAHISSKLLPHNLLMKLWLVIQGIS